jgi:hypothetical protein
VSADCARPRSPADSARRASTSPVGARWEEGPCRIRRRVRRASGSGSSRRPAASACCRGSTRGSPPPTRPRSSASFPSSSGTSGGRSWPCGSARRPTSHRRSCSRTGVWRRTGSEPPCRRSRGRCSAPTWPSATRRSPTRRSPRVSAAAARRPARSRAASAPCRSSAQRGSRGSRSARPRPPSWPTRSWPSATTPSRGCRRRSFDGSTIGTSSSDPGTTPRTCSRRFVRRSSP